MMELRLYLCPSPTTTCSRWIITEELCSTIWQRNSWYVSFPYPLLTLMQKLSSNFLIHLHRYWWETMSSVLHLSSTWERLIRTFHTQMGIMIPSVDIPLESHREIKVRTIYPCMKMGKSNCGGSLSVMKKFQSPESRSGRATARLFQRWQSSRTVASPPSVLTAPSEYGPGVRT